MRLKLSCSHSNQSPQSDWIHIVIVKVTIELRKGMALSQEISTPTINNNFRTKLYLIVLYEKIDLTGCELSAIKIPLKAVIDSKR